MLVDLPPEILRVRSLIDKYARLGPAGRMALSACCRAIATAENALKASDEHAEKIALQQLKECK